MHQQRIAIAITAGLGILFAFLPWLSEVPWYGSLNGTKVDGGTGGMWVSAAVLVGMFVGRRNAPLTPGGYGLCRLAGIFIALSAVYAIAQLDRIGADSHIGIGPYFTIAVGVAVAVLPNIVKGAPAPPPGGAQTR